MKHLLTLALLFATMALFAACGDDRHDHDGSGTEAGHGHDDHDHDGGGHDHDDHAHADEGHDDRDDHDHSDKIQMGERTLGAFKVRVARFGAIEADAEAVLDIDIEGEGVQTVRGWVGLESGKGSRRSKIDGKDGAYHGHLEVPGNLAEGSKVWIEIEDAEGARHKASFAFE